MNYMPLLGFWMRRHEQISGMTTHSGGGLALFEAVLPVIKKYWPDMNKNGILDDALATLKEVTGTATGDHPFASLNNPNEKDFGQKYPDPTQR